MRLGILGGTFDPIHFAHLFIAEEARARYGLERVLFVPNAVSPFKTEEEVTPAKHRYAMTCLAMEGNPAFEASQLEIERPGPSFTVETLRTLRSVHPTAELFFITGADAVAEIEEWREPEEVLSLARVIAAARPGYSFDAIRSHLSPAARKRIDLIDTLPLDLSATTLRARVTAGLPIRYLTPDAVVNYIERHGLYREGT